MLGIRTSFVPCVILDCWLLTLLGATSWYYKTTQVSLCMLLHSKYTVNVLLQFRTLLHNWKSGRRKSVINAFVGELLLNVGHHFVLCDMLHAWLTGVGDKFHFMIVDFHQSIYQSFLTYYKCQSIWQRSFASSCWKLRIRLYSSEIKKEMCPFTSNTMTRFLFDTSTRTLFICR